MSLKNKFMENLQSCFCVMPSTHSDLSHESLGTDKVPVLKVTILKDKFQVSAFLQSLEFSTVV